RALLSFPTRRSSDLLPERALNHRLKHMHTLPHSTLTVALLHRLCEHVREATNAQWPTVVPIGDVQSIVHCPLIKSSQYYLLSKGDRKSTRLNSSHVS